MIKIDSEIYYFSGTGNTLVAAKKATENLPNSKLIHISKAIEDENLVIESETLGLIIPLYFFGLPEIVSRFIKCADLTKVKYIFAIVTRGFPAIISGGAMTQLKQELKIKGKKLDAGFYLRMGDNFIIYWWNPTRNNELKRVIHKANEKIDKIIDQIINKKSRIETALVDLIFPFFKYIPYTGNNYYQKNAKKLDRFFYVTEKCNECGICSKVCSVKNIKIKKRPVWLSENCQLCLACIHFCPTKAIQFGQHFTQLGQDTKNKYRYKYPDITYQDLFLD